VPGHRHPDRLGGQVVVLTLARSYHPFSGNGRKILGTVTVDENADRYPRPVLHARAKVPFAELQPEPFASFVHSCLERIGSRRDWRDFQQSSVGADGGFDSWCTNARTSHQVCIQCKRLADPFSLPEVGVELVKVALEAAIGGSHVGEHLIVTSGKVRDVLRRAQREENRETLLRRTLDDLATDQFIVLRSRVAAAGLDAQTLVREYVTRIRLTVWSGDEFDNQLGSVWDLVQSEVARVFSVHQVVSEYPRPDFDESAYLKRALAMPFRIEPWCDAGTAPDGVRPHSFADPLAGSRKIESLTEPQRLFGFIGDGTSHGSILLVGDGGTGKTAALELVRKEFLLRREIDGYDIPLPVILQLSSCRNGLDSMVHSALGVRRGHWRSIPGRFLFLLDALDEVPADMIAVLQAEIESLERDGTVSIVITSRPSGPRAPVVTPITRVGKLMPMEARDVSKVATERLGDVAAEAFVDAWTQRASSSNFFARAQAVAACVAHWQTHREIPSRRRALMEVILDVERGRSPERSANLPERLGSVPYDIIRGWTEALVCDTWLRDGGRIISGHQLLAVLGAVVGPNAGLSSWDCRSLLQYHGFIIQEPDGTFHLPHSTVCAYLASRNVARGWREMLSTHVGAHFDEAWFAAAPLIADPHAFLDAWWDRDFVMACRLATEIDLQSYVESRLLKMADELSSHYGYVRCADALSVLATDACVNSLRRWATEFGEKGRQLVATRMLATLGDVDILVRVLTEIDVDDSSPIRVSGEERALWDSAPITARLTVARLRVETVSDGLLGQSFVTLGNWGRASDAELIRSALDRKPRTSSSLVLAIRALQALSPGMVRQSLEALLQQVDPGERVNLLGFAIDAGIAVSANELLSIALVETALEPPLEEPMREVAIRLLPSAVLSPEDMNRIVTAIERRDAVAYWGWRAVQVLALEEGLVRAMTCLSNVDADVAVVWNAARVLACLKRAGAGRYAVALFEQRFPTGLCEETAYHLVSLALCDELSHEASRMVERVFRWLVEHVNDRENAMSVRFACARWGDRFSARDDLLLEAGPETILSLDLVSFSNARVLVERCLALMSDAEIVLWLPGVETWMWRVSLFRLVAATRPGLRPRLVEPLCAELMKHTRLLVPDGLLEAIVICWCDRLAESVVDALEAMPHDGSNADVTFRADQLQARLSHHYSREQGEAYVKPAARRALDPGLRSVLQFLFEKTQRRR